MVLLLGRYANLRNRNAIIVERSSCSFKSMQGCADCWPSPGHTCYQAPCHTRDEDKSKENDEEDKSDVAMVHLVRGKRPNNVGN